MTKVSTCLSVCLSVCLSACLSDCLPFYLSVGMLVFPFFFPYAYLSPYLSVWLLPYLYLCLSVGRSVCLSVGLSVCLSISLSACSMSFCLFFCLLLCLTVCQSRCQTVSLTDWLSNNKRLTLKSSSIFLMTSLLMYRRRAVSGICSFIFIMHSVSRISWISWGSQFTYNSPVSGCRTNNDAWSPEERKKSTNLANQSNFWFVEEVWWG